MILKPTIAVRPQISHRTANSLWQTEFVQSSRTLDLNCCRVRTHVVWSQHTESFPTTKLFALSSDPPFGSHAFRCATNVDRLTRPLNSIATLPPVVNSGRTTDKNRADKFNG